MDGMGGDAAIDKGACTVLSQSGDALSARGLE